jgi:hypothetical protein
VIRATPQGSAASAPAELPPTRVSAGASVVTVVPPASVATAESTNTAAAHGVPRAASQHALRGTLPEELDLLHDAQSKWRAGNASAALALLAEHRARFPHSDLAPERDALTVLSLCATSHTAEARRLAQRFLKHARSSPLRTAVEESCGGE